MSDTLDQLLQALGTQVGSALRDSQNWAQVGLFLLISGAAWLLARLVWRVRHRWTRHPWQDDLATAYFPLIALLLGRIVRAWLLRQGESAPLFELLYKLYWLLLAYRLVATVVRQRRPAEADRIQRTVLVPLLILAAIFHLSGLVEPLLSILNGATLFRLGSGESAITVSVGLLLVGPLALLLILALAQGLRSLLISDLLPGVGLPAPQAYAVGTLSSYAVIAVGTLIVLSALGISPTTLTFVGSALAVGIGFGLQNTVNNMVSGLLIMFDPLMNVGDVVEVANERGTIRQIGIRNTVIEASDGTRVVMPNATLSSSPVLNLSSSTRSAKQTLTLNVSSGADAASLSTALVAILAAHPNVRQQPPPIAQLQGMSQGSLTFLLTYYVTRVPEAPQTAHELSLALLGQLQQRGVTLAPVGPLPPA